MNYVFSDLDWQLVLDSYKKNQSLLSPIMRGNISNLIGNISSTKTIINMQQANLIIALLQCKNDNYGADEFETPISTEAEKENDDFIAEEKNIKLIILLEQLRLFVLQCQKNGLINKKDLESLIERK